MLFKKPSYIFYAINICLLALALGIFIKADVSEDQKAKSGFQSNYQIYSIPTPEFCTFAGQKISLRDPDAQESFDREMLTNVYWQ